MVSESRAGACFLTGQFISWLRPYVEQNSVYFLMSGENSLQNFLISSGFPLKSRFILKSSRIYIVHPLDLVLLIW